MALKKQMEEWALRLKPLHWGYNLLNRKRILSDRATFRRYGIHRPRWFSLNASTFTDKSDREWWPEVTESQMSSVTDARVQNLVGRYSDEIRSWTKEGYLVLPGLLSGESVEIVNEEITRLLQKEEVGFNRQGNKIMFALRKSEAVRKVIDESGLHPLMDLLMGKETSLFQSINFLRGSEQGTHSDSIHMSTHPRGGLIAAWIALEDVSEENGPLHYYPGSHKLPYINNVDFGNEGNALMLGGKPYAAYTEVVNERIDQAGLKKKIFTPKKGDVFIWHANLLHGGEPIGDPNSTRKSMVLHYFSPDHICYHEISQRPALKML